MKTSHTRTVMGLLVLAVLCTVALGLQERRSTPLTASTRDSPVETGLATPSAERSALPWLRKLGMRLTRRAFWIEPWPWIGVGVLGFGGLAWALIWGSRKGRD
jgi:hypothetical protein